MRNRRPFKKSLSLDKAHKKFLGVCAGVAQYLEVEPWSVRLVFLVSILFGGWFLIPIYFIAWFCLDDKTGDGLSGLTDSQTMKHFRTVDYKKQMYRNTEDGKFLGVCAGVADYLEVNVFAVRLGFLILVFFTAALPMFLYFGAYFILEEKPHSRLRRGERVRRKMRDNDTVRKATEAGVTAGLQAARNVADSMSGKVADDDLTTGSRKDEFEEEFMADEEVGPFNTKSHSRRREFKYCARKFSTLQNRLAKMEAYVTSSQFRLHREFKNI